MTCITLNYVDIALVAALVVINAAPLLRLETRLGCWYFLAAVWLALQPTLVGLVLKAAFAVASPVWTGLAALLMIIFVGREVMLRRERCSLG